MSEEGLLYIVSGPSGTGKTSLCEEVKKMMPGLNLSISYTTRPARDNEIDGQDYFFVSREAFRTMINNAELIEWAEVYGHFYGTSLKVIEKTLNNGLDLLVNIDCQGAEQLKKKYPRSISIFVLPPSSPELEKRLRKRNTDSPEIIERRVKKSREEMAQAKKYDYIIINEIFDETLQVLHSIIIAEKHRGRHQP